MTHRGLLKQKLRSRERVFGTWTSLAHPSITEMFTQSNADFVGIDIEHSTISLEQSLRIIAASHAGGAFCLPRIASHNPEMIKRLLDSGADGLIVPMVSTSEEVEKLVSWMKYPPIGRRSFGIARAQNYGVDFDSYVQSWNSSSTLIIQIESIEGVKNIDQLLAHDGVDGAMIGPYDLSGSLGIPGQIDHPRVLEACDQVIAACRKHGKACGTQDIDPDQKSVAAKFAAGFSFVILASDIFLLWKWSAKMQELVKTCRQPS